MIRSTGNVACDACGAALGRHNALGYCARCSPTAYACEVPDCTGRVSSASRSRVCRAHSSADIRKFSEYLRAVRRYVEETP